jgi:hypothetical protein
MTRLKKRILIVGGAALVLLPAAGFADIVFDPSNFAEAVLRRLPAEGIADKELSALLARDRLVPIVHETTYEALREISPLLGSRSGLSTAEDTMASVAAKLAELVAVELCPATNPSIAE